MTTMNVMTRVCGTATCYGATDTITDTTNSSSVSSTCTIEGRPTGLQPAC